MKRFALPKPYASRAAAAIYPEISRLAELSKQSYFSFKIDDLFWRRDMVVHNPKILLLDKTRQKAVDEFVNRATKLCGDRIRGITLFGSVARGTPHRDSDIDLLVVIDKEDIQLRRYLIGLAFDILLETGGDISVKVLSSRDFEDHKSFSFLRNVLVEGVRVA